LCRRFYRCLGKLFVGGVSAAVAGGLATLMGAGIFIGLRPKTPEQVAETAVPNRDQLDGL